MLYERKCYSGICDNCGVVFSDWHSDFSIFTSDSDVEESMENNEWYTGYTDPDHDGKHYCPNCFKQHPEIDDKIIVDESSKTTQP